ncbi:universal stress protein [Georgenia faecalis]|uniref:Universal stress protein n=1 Tax=Georgenia faecalis TaxID=2483799 RepID=A0ABV9D7H2_9MICO|nr:universal stress protein [Georgenia faecalis]
MVESQPSGAVVVAIDGTDKDAPALRWAADEADCRDVPLSVVHAFPWVISAREYGSPPPEDVIESTAPILDHAVAVVRERHPDLAVSAEVVMERPAVALVRASQNAAALVLGARGLGPLRSRLIGSVSQKVAAHASGTVVVVREDVTRPEGPVVVGVDAASAVPAITEFAFRHAAARHVGVRLVHALDRQPPVPGLADARVRQVLDRRTTEGEEVLRALADEWSERFPGVPVEADLVETNPVEALVVAAAHASLLVVGSRSRHGLAGLRLGSVARGVLHEVPVVAIVRVEHAED